MDTGRNVLAGMLIGGLVGWLVGELLADQFAPEYYTEEELEELTRLYNTNVKEPEEHTHIPAVAMKPHKATEENLTMPKKDYRSKYQGPEKPELEKLVNKYNNPDYSDEENFWHTL